jgi:hypothetical protein
MKNLSVVGKGYHTEEKVIGFYNVGDRVKFWGSRGAFWGGLWGLTNPLISVRSDLAPIRGRRVDPGCHRGAGLDHGQGGAFRGDSRLYRRAIWA